MRKYRCSATNVFKYVCKAELLLRHCEHFNKIIRVLPCNSHDTSSVRNWVSNCFVEHRSVIHSTRPINHIRIRCSMAYCNSDLHLMQCSFVAWFAQTHTYTYTRTHSHTTTRTQTRTTRNILQGLFLGTCRIKPGTRSHA